jgi:hypothetical protein
MCGVRYHAGRRARPDKAVQNRGQFHYASGHPVKSRRRLPTSTRNGVCLIPGCIMRTPSQQAQCIGDLRGPFPLVATPPHRPDPSRVRRASLTLRIGMHAEQSIHSSKKRPSPTHKWVRERAIPLPPRSRDGVDSPYLPASLFQAPGDAIAVAPVVWGDPSISSPVERGFRRGRAVPDCAGVSDAFASCR